MSSLAKPQQPSPELFFDTMNAYQRTAALKGAIHLDLFTAIAEGNTTPGAIAARCQASERGIRILCDYLVIIGFLTKQGSAYQLSADSATFLDRRSPAYLGSAEGFLASPLLIDAFKDIAAAVRKGGTVIDQHALGPEHPAWVEFARSMGPMMAFPAEQIAKLTGADSGGKWKVLDIAAGHGIFGITIAKHNPNATIFALDWSNVLEVAKENAQKAGIAARYRTIGGSAFDVDLGSDYDLVLLTNFLHHFDIPSCETILRKVRSALAPTGQVVTLEFVPNDDRVSPPTTAAFSLMMLGWTPAGDAYTFAEYERMFRNAGYSRNEIHPLPSSPQSVIVSRK
jgi:ubiquinone/menaquinone biosynthesis C-methylase UbiE